MATTYHEATTLPISANHIAVIATSTVYDHYLKAARENLDRMLRLAQGCKDAEFAAAAQGLLDAFDSAAIGALELIEDANANQGALSRPDGEAHWRESIYAERAGLAQ